MALIKYGLLKSPGDASVAYGRKPDPPSDQPLAEGRTIRVESAGDLPFAGTLDGEGVGATFTANSPGTGVVVGGKTLAAGDKFLLRINGGPFKAYAGLWVATDLGNEDDPAIITRSPDFDEIDPDKAWPGVQVKVAGGDEAGYIYVASVDVNGASFDQPTFDLKFWPIGTDTVGVGNVRVFPDAAGSGGAIEGETLRARQGLRAKSGTFDEGLTVGGVEIPTEGGAAAPFSAEVMSVSGGTPAPVVDPAVATSYLHCFTDGDPTLADGTDGFRKKIWFIGNGGDVVNLHANVKREPEGAAAPGFVATVTDGDVQIEMVWSDDEAAWVLSQLISASTTGANAGTLGNLEE